MNGLSSSLDNTGLLLPKAPQTETSNAGPVSTVMCLPGERGLSDPLEGVGGMACVSDFCFNTSVCVYVCVCDRERERGDSCIKIFSEKQ